MRLNQVTLAVTDLGASANFYQTLGLTLIMLSPAGYARFTCPAGDATLSLHRANRVAANQGAVVYFECDDLDERVAALKGRGVKFDQDPKDMPWAWREAHLRDPDGNRLCLFHSGGTRLNPPWHMRE